MQRPQLVLALCEQGDHNSSHCRKAAACSGTAGTDLALANDGLLRRLVLLLKLKCAPEPQCCKDASLVTKAQSQWSTSCSTEKQLPLVALHAFSSCLLAAAAGQPVPLLPCFSKHRSGHWELNGEASPHRLSLMLRE